MIPRSNSSYLVESDYFAIFLHKFSRSALPSLEQTEHYLYWACQMMVVVELASALARMEGEAAYIQVAEEVHHDLAAPSLVRLLVPSSCPAVHPSSYPVDPLHPDQMDKAFVHRQDVPEVALEWAHRGPSSPEELDRDTSC